VAGPAAAVQMFRSMARVARSEASFRRQAGRRRTFLDWVLA